MKKYLLCANISISITYNALRKYSFPALELVHMLLQPRTEVDIIRGKSQYSLRNYLKKTLWLHKYSPPLLWNLEIIASCNQKPHDELNRFNLCVTWFHYSRFEVYWDHMITCFIRYFCSWKVMLEQTEDQAAVKASPEKVLKRYQSGYGC